MSKARLLLEAVDTGKFPDHIDRDKKRKIETGTHPYATNPAFPKTPGAGSWPGEEGSHVKPGGKIQSYADLAASDQYSRVVKNLSRYLGRTPQRGEINQILGGIQAAAGKVMRIEAAHKPQLEKSAVDLVLNLDEFSQAKSAFESGDLKIVAKLVTKVKVDAPSSPPEDEEEIEQVEQELDAEKHKRRFINMMTQGAAINKNLAFHLIDDELAKIDPGLSKLYGLVMSSADFAYWIMPEEVQKMMQSSGEGAAGKVRLKFENGVITIHAEAVMFPVLVQEIVKGLFEYISYDQDEDPETRKAVQAHTDVLDNEPWDIKLGPAVYRQLQRMIGSADLKWLPQVYKHLSDLPTGEFSKATHDILQGDAAGKRYVKDLLDEIKADQEGGEEPREYEDGNEPTGDEWKTEAKAGALLKHLLS